MIDKESAAAADALGLSDAEADDFVYRVAFAEGWRVGREDGFEDVARLRPWPSPQAPDARGFWDGYNAGHEDGCRIWQAWADRA